jgi:hypothetical protein
MIKLDNSTHHMVDLINEWPLYGGSKNRLGGGPVIIAWDQDICFLCGFRFEPCGCSYDGYRRLTWSLTSGPVRLVEVRASWPEHPH